MEVIDLSPIEVGSEEFNELYEAVRSRFRSHRPAVEAQGGTPPRYTAYTVEMAIDDELAERQLDQAGLSESLLSAVESSLPDLPQTMRGRLSTAKRWTESARVMAEQRVIEV